MGAFNINGVSDQKPKEKIKDVCTGALKSSRLFLVCGKQLIGLIKVKDIRKQSMLYLSNYVKFLSIHKEKGKSL